MFQPTSVDTPEYDATWLKRELDKTKTRTFMSKHAAFLGPLMCSLQFIWSEQLPTAATDGIRFWWNPRWFASLKPETRNTVLMHELWHVAWLHILRLGSRDAKIWNYAADIVINNMLEDEGYSFEGVENCWKDQQYAGLPTEKVYDLLMKQCQYKPQTSGAWGQGGNSPDELHDIFANQTPEEREQVISNVVRAVQTAKLAGQPGSVPGEIEEIISTYLAPKVDWRVELQNFFKDLGGGDFSWSYPNRRYVDDYLPSLRSEGRLEKLNYYVDVSGSISNADVIRFNSEVKYIKDTFNPLMLKVILFDTRITKVYEFAEYDPFDQLVVVGRGGTDLAPVHAHIEEDRPTAAVIFTDLGCEPMAEVLCPVIWVVINNTYTRPAFGRIIDIQE